ncbi:cysteine desulfurase NifS [Clostridium cylindrosporum]|uniref:Cysteine desulfurase IscS n=1 Tax=Clostridium cylindrosporum DSM 605 TaxID=1121307 RepID=A0A0J8G0H5_CLOCY|nr:cysteine desulfurase NifS [Clostridium cylindrosporum]KMT21296.1 cysteine desulfurase IscS [Clostridium cylindrosporum DSM 605]
MDKKIVYLDHSATTYVKKEVLDDMLPYFTENFGNPSSLYSISRKTKSAIDTSREKVAKALGAKKEEIYFTAGGSEADNWALKGVAFANKNKGNHIITTNIEHPAILNTCKYLEKQGFEVTYLGVNEEGLISLEELKNSIKDTTILISIMLANNEIGTIQPISEIGKIAKESGVIFHTDAVQAVGHVDINVDEMNVDLLSIAAHKFYGPKGIGALYIRKGIKIDNIIHGGGQERKKRAGTENIPAVVGIGRAIELATENMDEKNKEIASKRDRLLNGIVAKIPYTKVNGSLESRLPNNLNVSFHFIEGEGLLLLLDQAGICASTGSACSSGSLDPSHVLLAIGLPHEIAHGSLRLSLGEATTDEEIDYVLDVLPKIVQRLRDMSPLYSKAMGEVK